jgi:hypothetical protein
MPYSEINFLQVASNVIENVYTPGLVHPLTPLFERV